MRQAKWDVTTNIDWERFSSGEHLTFVEALHDSTQRENGFRFLIRGLIDSQGRFHQIGHEVIPTAERASGGTDGK